MALHAQSPLPSPSITGSLASTHLLILSASGELYGTMSAPSSPILSQDALVFMLDMCVKQGIECVKVQPG
jgi:hypothetical protein